MAKNIQVLQVVSILFHTLLQITSVLLPNGQAKVMYSTVQAVVSLNGALKVLRTDAVKESFVKIVDTSSAQQRRFTTLIINAACPSDFIQL